jgi:hypothetical protein
MQTRHPLTLVAAIGLLTLGRIPLAAQANPSPDSVQVLLNHLAVPLLLSRPTLVALYPFAVFDSAARMPAIAERNHPELPRLAHVADSLGFDFVMRTPETAAIQDQRYAAVYRAPSGTTTGFILFAPGLRPKVLPRKTPEERLIQELADYGARARQMSHRAS